MKKTYFVTRHQGAREWAVRHGLGDVDVVAHFDPEIIHAGDVVIGTLPVNLIASVCERGGRYMHLSINLTADDRGKEISADRMAELGARLEEYLVIRVNR